MNSIYNNFTSIEQVTGQYFNTKRPTANNVGYEGLSFEEILNQKKLLTEQSSLKFSKHANNRMLQRDIALSKEQVNRLEDGAQRAGEKGMNESLVIVDQYAFIVNVPNNTVITAIDQTQATENVFTNIDGAVIV